MQMLCGTLSTNWSKARFCSSLVPTVCVRMWGSITQAPSAASHWVLDPSRGAYLKSISSLQLRITSLLSAVLCRGTWAATAPQHSERRVLWNPSATRSALGDHPTCKCSCMPVWPRELSSKEDQLLVLESVECEGLRRWIQVHPTRYIDYLKLF